MCNSASRGNQEKVQCPARCHPENGTSGTQMTQPSCLQGARLSESPSLRANVLLMARVLEMRWSDGNITSTCLGDSGRAPYPFAVISYKSMCVILLHFLRMLIHGRIPHLWEKGLNRTFLLLLKKKWQSRSDIGDGQGSVVDCRSADLRAGLSFSNGLWPSLLVYLPRTQFPFLNHSRTTAEVVPGSDGWLGLWLQSACRERSGKVTVPLRQRNTRLWGDLAQCSYQESITPPGSQKEGGAHVPLLRTGGCESFSRTPTLLPSKHLADLIKLSFIFPFEYGFNWH